MADELTPIQSQVLAVNRAFYDAFEALDTAAMAACWEHGDRVACAHPGGPWLRGWDEVLAGWTAIMGQAGYMEIEVHEPHVEIADPVAWVTCVEHVTAGGEGRPPSVADLTATNVFVLGAQGWRMVSHHAAPMIGGPASQR